MFGTFWPIILHCKVCQHNYINSPNQKQQQYCDSNGNLSSSVVHVHDVVDVVTDCSYALAEFLVSTLFGAFSGQS